MHKNVLEPISNRRQGAIETLNAATNTVGPKFFAGNLVVVCKAKCPAHKLSFTWFGSPRVVAITSPDVCVVEDIITHEPESIHVAQLKRYCVELDRVDVPPEVLDHADRTTATYEIVSEIVCISKREGKLSLRIHRDGLPDEHDFTWASHSHNYEDIPEMVKDVLRYKKKKCYPTRPTNSLRFLYEHIVCTH